MSIVSSKFHDEGFLAVFDNKTWDDCPYPFGTMENSQWYIGMMRAGKAVGAVVIGPSDIPTTEEPRD